jgi:pilus assembly protein CpaF
MAADPRTYLESSFLKDLLFLPGITDISYNGQSLNYVTNEEGRKRAEFVPSKEEVGDFLRQIANLCERQFSYSAPILDVSFGPYRLNAVHASLCRSSNEKSYSFSLRLASASCRLEGDAAFFGGSEGLLLEALKQGESIAIGGTTSSGKTELEKWCLLHLGENRRVIVIDNVEELDLLENRAIDLTTWLVNEAIPGSSFSGLIRNALRNNPDYIVVAEARGKEMLDALNSAMSGSPIITTLHAQRLEQMPERMARMAMMANERLYLDDLLTDIAAHFRYFVYLRKTLTNQGKIQRYVEAVGRYEEGQKNLRVLYRRTEL